jgi:hypothetical protein
MLLICLVICKFIMFFHQKWHVALCENCKLLFFRCPDRHAELKIAENDCVNNYNKMRPRKAHNFKSLLQFEDEYNKKSR